MMVIGENVNGVIGNCRVIGNWRKENTQVVVWKDKATTGAYSRYWVNVEQSS